jgi:hypothetical protein
MPLFTVREPTGSWWRDHSLSLVLAAMLTVQTAHALWAGHEVWLGEQQDHGSGLTGWPSDFWIWWSWEYNVSLVADTFGVMLIVLLSKWFYEVGSKESKGT